MTRTYASRLSCAALLATGLSLATAGSAAPQCSSDPAVLAKATANSAPSPQRGVWIATPDHNGFFASKAEMKRQLGEFKQLGINTVYVAMWNQGRTLFPSAVMKALTGIEIDEKLAGRDPLQEVIDAARGSGIAVYAWFEFGFASDFKGGPGAEIIRARPHWAALDAQGKQVEKNGFRWMNGLDPEVQDFMLSLLLEAAGRYDIAGIQGDDRLPALPSSGGYNPGTVALYRAEHGGNAPPNEARDPAWLAWRAGKLNDFMARLHARLKAARPALQISMSPSPYPWGYEEYLQDWPTWLRQGWVDTLSPQMYRYDMAGYRQVLHQMTREQLCPEDKGRVFPGLLLALGREYVAPAALLRQMVEENRREGLGGEVYFHSEGVMKRRALFKQVYR